MTTMKEHEETQTYASLKKAIRRGDPKGAVTIARGLLAGNPGELWRFLKQAASSEVSHTNEQTTVLVKGLFDNWMLDQNPVFVVHAVLALTYAPKGTSAMDYLSLQKS
jgi:hypothetical protein